MIRLIQRRLIIPRGDTGTFSIPVLTSSNMGDVSIFTIFNPLTHKKIAEKRMELSDGVLTVTFSHGDTVNLPAGQYVWDIKFYKNPVFAGEQLIDGEEIDSYYAAFSLPVCEIRETGDSLLMDDDTPQAKLAPDQIDLISAAITATQTAKEVAVNSAADAETSASAAASSAQVALESKDAALASQTSAATSESNAAESAAAAQVSATQAAQIAQQIHEEIPTKISDLVDDSGHYIKPETGIPASDLEETYLTSFTEEDPTVPEWAKQPQKPTYTAQEVGALPDDTFIPSKVSDLVDDSGHYTKPASGIPASDLEEQYVKFDDYATTTTAGVVKVGGLGIRIRDGEIQLSPASDRQIKVNSGDNSPIVASKGNQATFYGLANAAGDTTQSQSANPVGQYTDAAKAAIQAMLDVPSTADIPTNVSELTNDAGYLTEHQDISGKANAADLAAVATSGSYEDLSDKPTIPEVPVQDVQANGTSVLQNGVANIPKATLNGNFGLVKLSYGSFQFNPLGQLILRPTTTASIKQAMGSGAAITPSEQHISTFYGLATAAGDTTQSQSNNAVGQYTDSAKTAIQTMLDVPSNAAMTTAIGNAIGNINSFDMAVVQALPTEDISTHTIYLVPKTGETNDVYDEYVYINDAWEMVGNTQVDLSNYVQKTDYATPNVAGIVRVSNTYGVGVSNGLIGIAPALIEHIKGETERYKPIVPLHQHEAAFYGLAKAAGDTTQSQSDNAVGTYTDEAKAAIQQMLDVPSNSDMSAYATKSDTVLETSLSRGRKEGSTVGNRSFAFGNNVEASGESSFAIGNSSIASGSHSKAEGYKAVASGSNSHAEGNGTIANGSNTHAEGKYNIEQTIISDWIADMHYNIGDKVFHIFTTFECIEENTDATWDASHWKEYGFTSEMALVVGNGIGSTAEERSNAYALDWSGNGHYMGNIYVGANADSTGGTKVLCEADFATAQDIQNIINGGAGA